MTLKTLKVFLLVCLTVLSLLSSAFAYGAQGHRVVARIAEQRLNQRAKDAIAQIIRPDRCKDLACLSTWPDDLKLAVRNAKGPLAGNREALTFQRKFTKNAKWHFVNLPLATTEYTDEGRFSNMTDIVHMINTCIDVLEGKKDLFTTRQALRFLVHLVGDIHQPLHVGTGFYELAGKKATLIEEPALVNGAQ